MAFVLLFIGVALVISAIQGTLNQLGTLLKGDFTGKGNFLFWTVCILIVGSVGYVSSLKKLSDTFMALLIIVIIIANDQSSSQGGGFFAKLTSALNSSQNVPQSGGLASGTDPNQVTLPTGSGSSSSGGGSGGIVGDVEQYAALAAFV